MVFDLIFFCENDFVIDEFFGTMDLDITLKISPINLFRGFFDGILKESHNEIQNGFKGV